MFKYIYKVLNVAAGSWLTARYSFWVSSINYLLRIELLAKFYLFKSKNKNFFKKKLYIKKMERKVPF